MARLHLEFSPRVKHDEKFHENSHPTLKQRLKVFPLWRFRNFIFIAVFRATCLFGIFLIDLCFLSSLTSTSRQLGF